MRKVKELKAKAKENREGVKRAMEKAMKVSEEGEGVSTNFYETEGTRAAPKKKVSSYSTDAAPPRSLSSPASRKESSENLAGSKGVLGKLIFAVLALLFLSWGSQQWPLLKERLAAAALGDSEL